MGLVTVSKLLGHQKLATTARYAHPSREAEKVVASIIGDSISADLWAHAEDEDGES